MSPICLFRPVIEPYEEHDLWLTIYTFTFPLLICFSGGRFTRYAGICHGPFELPKTGKRLALRLKLKKKITVTGWGVGPNNQYLQLWALNGGLSRGIFRVIVGSDKRVGTWENMLGFGTRKPYLMASSKKNEPNQRCGTVLWIIPG